jgi:hypothetical protein
MMFPREGFAVARRRSPKVEARVSIMFGRHDSPVDKWGGRESTSHPLRQPTFRQALRWSYCNIQVSYDVEGCSPEQKTELVTDPSARRVNVSRPYRTRCKTVRLRCTYRSRRSVHKDVWFADARIQRASWDASVSANSRLKDRFPIDTLTMTPRLICGSQAA